MNIILKIDYYLLVNSIPNYIFNIITDKSERYIYSGIDYSDGSSSNLSLYPWIYEPNKDPLKKYQERESNP